MLLMLEAVLLALPLTLLLLFFSVLMLRVALETGLTQWRDLNVVPLLVLDLVALLAVAVEWGLLYVAFRRGAAGLRQVRPLWWYLAAVGLVPLVLGVIAMFLRLVQDDIYEMFLLGTPFLLILGHLWAEARFRKPDANV